MTSKLFSRPRTDSDDERLISRKPVKIDRVEDKVIFPLPPTTPIVYWDRPSTSKDVYSKEDSMKCVKWPLKTDVVCFQCCHAFEGVPVPLPYTYDSRRKVYKCKGNFCSWQCSKSYNINQTMDFGKGNRNMYISLLAHQTWIKYRKNTENFESMKTYATYSINPSSPRDLLKIFGGSMDIEEYRKGFYGIVPPDEALEQKPFITFSNRLLLPFTDINNSKPSSEKTTNSSMSSSGLSTTKQIETSTAHTHSNTFCNTLNRAKSEKIVMKRKREASSKNTLMSTMGVVIETKKR